MRSVFGWVLSAAALCVALDLVGAALAGWRWRADYEWLLGLSVALMFVGGALLAAPGAMASRRWPAAAPLSLALVGLPLLWPAAKGPAWLVGLALAPLVIAAGWSALWRRGADRLAPLGWIAGGLAAALGLFVALSADVPGAEAIRVTSRTAEPRPNVILVVLDTVRADHLELYGYDRKTMPWLTAFAKTATVYETASSASSWTLPSHATLFTGLLPPKHGADYSRNGMTPRGRTGGGEFASPLPKSAKTLAERLRDVGYQTAGFCANSAFLDRRFGLAQGFDTWVDSVPQSDVRPVGARLASLMSREALLELQLQEKPYWMGPEINGFVAAWLGQGPSGPQLVFVNLMEAHAPNLPLRSFREAFPLSWGPPVVDRYEVEAGIHLMTDRERQGLRDAYDAELLSLDQHLGLLFEQLKRAGLLEGSMVVITADHGEGLGEHGHLEHNTSLFDSETRIPLVVRYPGQVQSQRGAASAHLVDVVPTVLEALGLPPDTDLNGVPLQTGVSRPLFSWLHRPIGYVDRHPGKKDHVQVAVTEGPWKLIRWGDGSFHLYDRARDPGEKFDVADQRPELVEAYRAAMVGRELSLGRPLPIDDDEPRGGPEAELRHLESGR